MEDNRFGLKRWHIICMGIVALLGVVRLHDYRSTGDTKLPSSVRVTIPEGFTNEEIAGLFDERFSYFDHDEFLALAPQGYMFPDTYYVGLYMDASSTISVLKDNFENRIFPFRAEIQSSGKDLDDIVNMASILESEVKSMKDRKIVSGILWKRLEINMALQVDSSPETYEHPGFPDLPISNPGLDSLVAALHPTDSPYLYFLTDKAGNVHYGKTFDEHKENRAKYLNK
jgi:UPF0755 protein